MKVIIGIRCGMWCIGEWLEECEGKLFSRGVGGREGGL